MDVPSTKAGKDSPSTFSDEALEPLDLIVEEMVVAWQDGHNPTAGEILEKHPELGDEAAIRLIFEEVSLRREAGQSTPTAEIIAAYPRWRDELGPLLGFDKMMREPAGRSLQDADFPTVGGRVGEFRLLCELGRGASGRTFLAAQPSLADRPVVLKVMARDHSEHLSLAQLQHTHIVPLYWEQEFPEYGLRGLLMPYLGGSNLAEVSEEMGKTPFDERTGADIVDALIRLENPTSVKNSANERRPPNFLNAAAYDQVACWIGVCLAEALQYAHRQGLIHMDVKPSNVLISSDGQPMLLDFHLARSPIEAGLSVVGRLGGTPGWTSPEQRAAMRAVFEGRPIETAVDGRSDIYGLGLLLYELLGGTLEYPEKGIFPRLSDCNDSVSVGLSDIVHHCLAPDPRDRYPNAAMLAEDLRRHIDDRPLAGIPNRSPLERWRKWRRRSPHAFLRGTARISVVAAALVVGLLVWLAYRERVRSVENWAEESEARWGHRAYIDSYEAADKGLSIFKGTRFIQPDLTNLHRLQKRAEWGRSAQDLHAVADFFRFTYGAISDEPEKVKGLAPKLREVWEQRHRLLPPYRLNDAVSFSTLEILKQDYRELAVLYAHLRTELDPEDADFNNALEILNQAEKDFDAGPALTRMRQSLEKRLGREQETAAEELLPTTPWEHYELGRLHHLNKRYEEAVKEYHASLVSQPLAFWPNFFEGNCDYELGRYEEAVAAYRVCESIMPNSPNVRVNRALAYEAMGKLEEALAENSEAVRLDDKLVEAYFNRGHVAYKLDRPGEAIPDLKHALTLDSERVKSTGIASIIEGRIRFVLACAYRSIGENDASEIEARKAEELGWKDAESLHPKAKSPR